MSATGSAADPWHAARPASAGHDTFPTPFQEAQITRRSIHPGLSLARASDRPNARGGGRLATTERLIDVAIPGETGCSIGGLRGNLRFSRTSGSIVVGLPVQRPDADPSGHADLLVGPEVPEVGRLQRVEPADLAALVADDHPGQDWAEGGQRAEDALGDVAVVLDLVVAQAERRARRRRSRSGPARWRWSGGRRAPGASACSGRRRRRRRRA